VSNAPQVEVGVHGHEPVRIDSVLQTTVGHRQHLQAQQVFGACYWQCTDTLEGHGSRAFNHLLLDAAARGQKIDLDALWRKKAYRREPALSLVFDACERSIALSSKLEDQAFGVRIVVDDHGEVDIASETHLGAHGHCEATH
jgi:hypothetical protein